MEIEKHFIHNSKTHSLFNNTIIIRQPFKACFILTNILTNLRQEKKLSYEITTTNKVVIRTYDYRRSYHTNLQPQRKLSYKVTTTEKVVIRTYDRRNCYTNLRPRRTKNISIDNETVLFLSLFKNSISLIKVKTEPKNLHLFTCM